MTKIIRTAKNPVLKYVASYLSHDLYTTLPKLLEQPKTRFLNKLHLISDATYIRRDQNYKNNQKPGS